MKYSRMIAGMLGVSAAATLAGCAESTEGPGTRDVSDGLAGEAVSAQYGCAPGTEFVYEAGMCVTRPYTIDYTPGARGCAMGAVITGRGNVVCIRYVR